MQKLAGMLFKAHNVRERTELPLVYYAEENTASLKSKFLLRLNWTCVAQSWLS